jgi:beta-D-xylosidase 4
MTNMSLRHYSSTNYSLNNPGYLSSQFYLVYQQETNEIYRRTYKWLDQPPTFPFGYGLHYTNLSVSIDPSFTAKISVFNISSLIPSAQNSSSPLDLHPFIGVPVTVANTGSVTSDYVVLGFLAGTYGPTPYPNKSLVAYQRLFSIESGSSQSTTLSLNLGSLARVDNNGDVILYPGQYRLGIDVDGNVGWDFNLVGDAAVLDSWPAPPPFGNSGN